MMKSIKFVNEDGIVIAECKEYTNECCNANENNKKLNINNKSLEFVKNRIKNNQTYLNLDDFDYLNQVSVYDIINKEKYRNTNGFLSNASITLGDKTSECEIRLNIDENSEYDYFTMCSCVCDGSLFFAVELMEKCINKIQTLQTYYNKVEVNIDTVKDKILQYTIGNFVLGCKNSYDFAPLDKPWMIEKFTVMLPIKFEILDKGVIDDESK